MLHNIKWFPNQCNRQKERHVLFNDALNTFNFQLYCLGRMLKDHSDSERGNLLPYLDGLLVPINKKRVFYMHHPTDRMLHTTDFVVPVVEH